MKLHINVNPSYCKYNTETRIQLGSTIAKISLDEGAHTQTEKIK